ASLGFKGADAAKAGEIAGDLYKSNFGDSVAGAGDAVAAVLQGGLAGIEASAGEIETITGKVITFADVFKQDMGESVGAVSAMLVNGLVPDANTALDQLTATMQQVPETMRGEVLSALMEYSPFFAQLGIDSEHAMAALARASRGGTIAIDKTGDALKELVIKAQDGTKLTSEALTDLGLDVDGIAGGFAKGGPAANTAMNEIIAALLRVKDPVKQTQLGVALLGTPFEDLGRDAIPTLQALQTGLGDVAGKAQAVVDAVGDTDAAKLEAFKRSMEDNVTKVAETAVRWLDKLPGPVQTAVATLSGLAPVMAPIAPILGPMIPLLWGAAGGFAAISLPVLATVAALALMGATIFLLIKYWDELPGPVQYAVRLIGAVVTGGFSELAFTVIKHWSEIKSATITGVQFVVDKMLGMAEWVLKAGAKAFGWVPGVGDKLRTAAAEVEKFRDETNAFLDSIRDKQINVTTVYATVYREGGERTYGGDSTAGIGQYALGGLFTHPTLGIFAEAGPELLLPLTDMDRTRELLGQAGLLAEPDVLSMGTYGDGSGASSPAPGSGGGRTINVGPFYGVRQDDLPTEIPRRIRGAEYLFS
ncbi:MAG TPA: phage tail tape measure protein, partial [Acidimicrobiales bacterium]|nr:phage tail tape measure protein [Acidimicrobiales bacterium]